jgi:Predicted acyl-CoA transferases/carnitine dehydratase
VLVSISAFGRDGPCAGYQATDLTLLAAGGLLSLGGYADSEPLAVQGEQAMLASGIYGAIAVLTALYERTQTGKGCWIDVSGQECVAFALEDAVAEWSINAHVRRRLGDGAREAGTGVYPCKDGHYQHGGGPSRHRQCVRHVDAVGRRLRGAGRRIVARAAMAGF